jgi:hypothetical protein
MTAAASGLFSGCGLEPGEPVHGDDLDPVPPRLPPPGEPGFASQALNTRFERPSSVTCGRMVAAPAPARIRRQVGILVRSLPTVDAAVVADAVGRDIEAIGTAGANGIQQVDSAVAVEHRRFTGMGIDSHDEHRPSTRATYR